MYHQNIVPQMQTEICNIICYLVVLIHLSYFMTDMCNVQEEL